MATINSQVSLDYEKPPVSKRESRTRLSDKLHEVELLLKEIMQEADEAAKENPEAQAIPRAAYDESLSVLKVILRDVSMPDLMGLEDGGICFEWRKGPEKIFTLSLYGNGYVIFVGIFGEKDKMRGVTPLLGKRTQIPRTLLEIISEHFPNENTSRRI